MAVKFFSRGIGYDRCPACFVCGAEGPTTNIAGFVNSKADGETVENWIPGSRLDFRPHEPNWIQVKLAVCKKHIPNLEELHRLTMERNCIDPEMISKAKEFGVQG